MEASIGALTHGQKALIVHYNIAVVTAYKKDYHPEELRQGGLSVKKVLF